MAERLNDDPFQDYILGYYDPKTALDLHKLNAKNQAGRYHQYKTKDGKVFHYCEMGTDKFRLTYQLSANGKLQFTGEAIATSFTDPDDDTEYEFEK